MKKLLILLLVSSPALAGTLFQELARESKGSGFVFSPMSVSQALKLADLGANGQTKSEIEAVFGADFGFKPESDEFKMANRIWIQKDFRIQDSYRSACKKEAGAEAQEVDFTRSDAAAKEINDWVAHETNDKIQGLVSPTALSRDLRLILTNAVYFKANWESAFPKEQTQDGDFETSPGKKIRVPFMHQKHRFLFAHTQDAEVLSMPYQGRKFSMMIILPKKGISITQFEHTFDSEKLSQLDKALHLESVRLSLPRFRVESEFQLVDVLGRLGIRSAFSVGRADFSGIDGKRDLFIGKVVHKAFVNVDEYGTEAAAATGTMMATLSMEALKPWAIQVNRPFLFLIREGANGRTLFQGRVMKP